MPQGRTQTTDDCPKCGGELILRQKVPYPVLIYSLFGLSFMAFFFFYEQVQHNRPVVWTWSVVQVVLGILLTIRRVQSRKRILRCIRCDQPID
jgi:hypothetical protein